MIGAEFQSPFGNPSTAFNQGESTGISVMDKAQQMEQSAAAEQRKQQIYDTMLPSIQAKAQADQATSQATLDHFQQIQDLRKQAANQGPGAFQEYQDALKIADFGDQAAKLSELQGKYSWMGQVPEYKGFVDSINEARVQAHGSALADMHLEGQLEVAKTAAESRTNVANIREQGLIDASTIKAGAAAENASTRANAPTALMKNVGAYAKAVASGDSDTADQLEFALQKQSGVAPTQIADSLSRMAANEQKLAAATDDPNEKALRTQNANAMLMRANSILSTKPAAEPSVQPPAAGGAKPSAAPAEGGKLYSINPETKTPVLSSAIKTPKDIEGAYQQMVDDGVMSLAEARQHLINIGWKPAK